MADLKETLGKHRKAILAAVAVAVAVTGYTTCAEDDVIVGQVGTIVGTLLDEAPPEP